MALAALSTADLINHTLKWVDGAADTSKAEYVSRRVRYELYAQELIVYLWSLKEWSWSLRSATLAAPNSSGRSSLPADFQELGRSGSIIDTATKEPFRSVDLRTMNRYLASSQGDQKDYIYQIGSAANDSATRYIWFPKGWSGVATIDIYYKKFPPAVSDAGTDEIEEIPIPLQWSILVPGMRWYSYRNANDPKGQEWYALFREGISEATKADTAGPQKDTMRTIGGSARLRIC